LEDHDQNPDLKILRAKIMKNFPKNVNI